MKRLKSLCIICPVICLLTGCGLIPEEEVLRTAPIVSEYKAEEYNYVLVERGDIQTDENVVCYYQPTKEETLSFQISGEYYGNVYLQVGDEVKKGDLLAELQMEDIDNAASDSKKAIKKIELSIEHLNNMIALEKERLIITKEENASSLDNYESQKIQAEDSLYIEQERLKEKEELKKNRQLYAGIDGIVTSIKLCQAGDRSIEGEDFITIMDSNLSFTAQTKNWDRFTIGQEVDVYVGDVIYKTIVSSMDEEANKDTGVKLIQFALTEPANLAQGARGQFALVLKEIKDMLSVPLKAVTTVGDKSIVYSIDKDGFKTVRTVEIGVIINSRVEILSGIEEGESVIMD